MAYAPIGAKGYEWNTQSRDLLLVDVTLVRPGLTDSIKDGGVFEPTKIPRYSAIFSRPSNLECVWKSTP